LKGALPLTLGKEKDRAILKSKETFDYYDKQWGDVRKERKSEGIPPS